MRAAPTEAALASGPSACAVPVVPKQTAASSTKSTKGIAILLHNPPELASIVDEEHFGPAAG
jgi:hypothetical protein